MIQIQTAVVYFATFYWKTLGRTWLNGTAVYYVLHLVEDRHFPLPAIDNLFVLTLLTWGTLAIEFSMGTLVWFRELRYPVLLAALCLHMGIEYALNIPLFEWISIAPYVTFIYPEDLSRARNRRYPAPRASADRYLNLMAGSRPGLGAASRPVGNSQVSFGAINRRRDRSARGRTLHLFPYRSGGRRWVAPYGLSATDVPPRGLGTARRPDARSAIFQPGNVLTEQMEWRMRIT